MLRTCCKGMVLVALSLVSAEGMLRGLIRCKVNGVGGTCTTVSCVQPWFCALLCSPAPMTTLDSPLHNDQNPSALDMVTMAFDMPLYIALGEGLTICILVCRQSAHRPETVRRLRRSRAP